MKILCFILSLYVVFLATTPCCSDDNCNDEIKTEQTDNHSQDHKDSDCNICSPFLTCGTCTGFNFPTVFFSLTPPAITLTTKIPINYSSFSSNYFPSIWQPPKISNELQLVNSHTRAWRKIHANIERRFSFVCWIFGRIKFIADCTTWFKASGSYQRCFLNSAWWRCYCRFGKSGFKNSDWEENT